MVDICEVLEHLIEEFEKIDGKDFKLKYKKVIVPADTTENDMTEVWSSLHWPVDESTSYPDFCPTWQLYEHEEDTEPSFIVHFALSGENVTNGWHIIKTPIKDAIGLLRLRRYDPDSIPDSGTFLDNFPRSKKEATDDFHTNIWCEFLLKLSQEDDCPILNKSIKPVPFQELPCKVNVEGLKTDVLTASKLALQYLLDKAEQRSRQKEFTGADRNNLSQERPAGTEKESNSTVISAEEKTTESNVSGMPWQEAKKKAEALVDEKEYLGHKKLYEAIGCSDNTLRKAIENSSKLQEAKKQYKSTSKTLKAVGFTAKVVATYEDSSGPKLSDTETQEILAEMLVRIKRERPEMFEQTTKQLDEMNPDGKRRFAAIYQRDYQNKDKSLSKDGPKTLRQYKQV